MTDFVTNYVLPAGAGLAGDPGLKTSRHSAGGGLYWLIPAVVCSLVGGVINAWLFLVNV